MLIIKQVANQLEYACGQGSSKSSNYNKIRDKHKINVSININTIVTLSHEERVALSYVNVKIGSS
jgi:uncharacterized protein YebE (UPF0316 family)